MDERSVEVALREGYHAEATNGRHVVALDEPVEAGGTDRGMRPTEIFLTSLGACAVITMRMYAQRKGWDLQDASVHVRLVRPDRGSKEPPRVTQTVTLVGDLDDDQRERLRTIAGRCPVHRLVEGPLEAEEILV